MHGATGRVQEPFPKEKKTLEATSDCISCEKVDETTSDMFRVNELFLEVLKMDEEGKQSSSGCELSNVEMEIT